MFRGVIFDCDGVLVDTEPLSMRVTQQAIADLGWYPSTEEMFALFLGSTSEHVRKVVEERTGASLSDNWLAPYRAVRYELFKRELRSIPYISEALDSIDLPIALASNSGHTHIEVALTLTGLYEHFVGRISSAHDVAYGKPAPDVYIHAARLLGLDPRECIAIDDSRTGVTAAIAAGMHVFAYKSPLTPEGSFDGLKAQTFDSMLELPRLIHAARDTRRRELGNDPSPIEGGLR